MAASLTSIQPRLARIRGSLPQTEPGARGLEHVARNPSCMLLRAATLANVSPAAIATHVLGLPPREEQSPFAIGTGTSFERHLTEKGASDLLELYRAEKRLGVRDSKVRNLVELVSSASPVALARRRTLTTRFIRQKLAGDPAAPNLIIKPRLTVALLGLPHDIEPDAFVAADRDRFYRPVEIKSYIDRAGKTDPSDLRSAYRQAAVGVYGLRELLRCAGVPDPPALVPLEADLVLRRPSSFSPTLRPMRLPGEYFSVAQALQAAPQDLLTLEAQLQRSGPGAALDDARTIEALPNNYLPSCREHCALAPYCKQRAYRASDPIVLGPQARERLAAAGSVARALDLLNGTGGPIRSPEEDALAAQLREADAAWKGVI